MRKQKFMILFLLLFALLIPYRAVWAKNPVSLEADHVEYRYLNDEDDDWFWNADDSEDIVDAKSTNEKVATVGFKAYCVTIHPVGVGKCDAIATDAKGNKATIHVTVEKSFIAEKLKHYTSLHNTWYGTKGIKVESLLGATGKLKIGSKTYKFTIPQKGNYITGEKRVKINKVFKLNSKVTCTVSVKSNGTTVTATVKDKLNGVTAIDKAVAKKKTLTISMFNLHKGDTIKVKYKGRTYSKKIKKDKDDKYSKVKITLKKKMAKNGSFVVTVTNKDKKRFFKEKIKLTNWKYEYVDEDIDDDSYDDSGDDSGSE